MWVSTKLYVVQFPPYDGFHMTIVWKVVLNTSVQWHWHCESLHQWSVIVMDKVVVCHAEPVDKYTLTICWELVKVVMDVIEMW